MPLSKQEPEKLMSTCACRATRGWPRHQRFMKHSQGNLGAGDETLTEHTRGTSCMNIGVTHYFCVAHVLCVQRHILRRNDRKTPCASCGFFLDAAAANNDKHKCQFHVNPLWSVEETKAGMRDESLRFLVRAGHSHTKGQCLFVRYALWGLVYCKASRVLVELSLFSIGVAPSLCLRLCSRKAHRRFRKIRNARPSAPFIRRMASHLFARSLVTPNTRICNSATVHSLNLATRKQKTKFNPGLITTVVRV